MQLNMKYDSIFKVSEILILILISFSPLIPSSIVAVVTLFLVLSNVKYMKPVEIYGVLIFLLFNFFLLIGIINDFRNISTSSNIHILSLYYPLSIFLGFIISQKYEKGELLFLFDKVIYFFAVCSLVGVLIYTFFPGLVYSFPVYHYYHTTRHTAFLFNFLIGDGGEVLTRNSGVAWEPGAFQFLLNLGLYAYISTNKRVSILKIFLYAFVIFTTKSTAGILILTIIIFKIMIYDKRMRWLFVLLIVIFSIPIIEEIGYQYNQKLFGSYAFQSRFEPMVNAFRIGFHHPLGLGNLGYDFNYRILNLGAFDSYGQIIVRYGFGLIAVVLISLQKIFRDDRILFFIIFITFASLSIWFLPLITPFYFMNTIFYKTDRSKIHESSMAG